MRLLNAWTLKVEEFHERDAPPYAILSHTWGDEEVLLQDIQSESGKSLKGYSKISGCCEQARQDGLEHVWIDTCCIDKTSSTELAEAINSMFTWYRKSVICYAYLEDVDGLAIREDTSLLGQSRWFTRGWTLQELIAPGLVTFFGAKWEEIGSRESLVHVITEVTGIDQGLFDHGKLSQYSVAQRMSWASKRKTTRPEDEAYCLLGLFGVTMPLVYGEGNTAFIRLQEEIMRRSDDQSIFAWTMTESITSGLLAPSPLCFENAGSVSVAHDSTHQSPFFLTNKGVQIALPIMEWIEGASMPMNNTSRGPMIVVTPPDTLIAVLNCQTQPKTRLGLAIDRASNSEQYHRVNADAGPFSISEDDCQRLATVKTIIVRAYEPLHDFSLWDQLRPTFFSIRGLSHPLPGYERQIFGTGVNAAKTGMISARLPIGKRAGVIFAGMDHAFGVFFAETWNQSCWELVTGTKVEVERLGQLFQHKDESLLTSESSLRLPLGGTGISSQAATLESLEVSMETVRCYPGYYSVVKILPQRRQRTGGEIAELPRSDNTHEGAKGIGRKKSTKYSDRLSTQFPRGRHPQADRAPVGVAMAQQLPKRKWQERIDEDESSVPEPLEIRRNSKNLGSKRRAGNERQPEA